MRDPQPSAALYELLEEIGALGDASAAVSAFDRRLRSILTFDSMAVLVPRDEGLKTLYASPDEAPAGLELAGRVAELRRPAFHRCLMAVPLEDDAGLVGVLVLYSLRPEAFEAADLGVLLWIRGEVARLVRRALAAAQYAEALARMAKVIEQASAAERSA